MKTNKLNVAAALRAAARPSMESEGSVVTNNATPEVGEATAETDLEVVKSTITEVGERSDLEAADTELKGAGAHHDGTETVVTDSDEGRDEVAMEGFIDLMAIKAVKAIVKDPAVIGDVLKNPKKYTSADKRLARKVERLAESVKYYEGELASHRAALKDADDEKRKSRLEKAISRFETDLADSKEELAALNSKIKEITPSQESMDVSQESLVAVGIAGALVAGGLGWMAGKQRRKITDLQVEIAAIEKKIIDTQRNMTNAADTAVKKALDKGLLVRTEGDGTEAIAINPDIEDVKKLINVDKVRSAEFKETGMAIAMGLFGATAVVKGAALGGPIGMAIGAACLFTGTLGTMAKNAAELKAMRQDLIEKRRALTEAERELLEGLSHASNVATESHDEGSAEEGAQAAAQAAANVAMGAQAAAEAAAAACIAADAEVIGEPVEDAAAVVEVEAESEETEAEIEDDVAHVEEYEKEAVALEALIEAARDARDAGGFSRGEARLFQIGFESIGTRLTGSPFLAEDGGSAVPSLESFGGTMSRRDATSISLENAESWLAKIIRVIKETWNKVIGAVKKFMSQVFDLCERYKARAIKVKEAAAKARNQKGDGAVKFGSASKIAIKGKVDASGVEKLVQLASVGEKLAELTPPAQAKLSEILYAMGNDTDRVGTEIADYYASQQRAIIGVFSSTGVFSDTGDARVADGLPGNVKITASSNKGDIGQITVEHGEAGEITEARALSGQEVGQLMDKVISALDEVIKSKAALAKVKDDIVKPVAPSSDDVADKAVAGSVRLGGRLAMAMTRSTSKLLGYVTKTSGAYIDYGVASIKAAGVPVAEKQANAAA